MYKHLEIYTSIYFRPGLTLSWTDFRCQFPHDEPMLMALKDAQCFLRHVRLNQRCPGGRCSSTGSPKTVKCVLEFDSAR